MASADRGGLLKCLGAICVAGAVVAAPWLFAGAEPWACLSLCLAVGFGTGAWLTALVCQAEPQVRMPGPTVALLALLAFVGLQTLPSPKGLVERLSPSAAQAEQEGLAALRAAGVAEFAPGLLPERPRLTLSVAPQATVRTFYVLAACVGTFVVLANTLTDWGRLERFAGVLVVSGFLLALVGLVQKLSGTRRIYGFYDPPYGGDIFGPFTNRNHFAAFANMTLGVNLGLLMASLSRQERRRPESLGEWTAWFSTRRGSRTVLLAFGAALLGAATFATLSRAGIASLAASLAAAGFAAVCWKASSGRRLIVGLAGLMLVGVVWLGWRPVLGRLGTLAEVVNNPLANPRAGATRDTLRLFAAHPALGCGFGAFQHAFPPFQGQDIQIGRWLHAHNEYAELLADGGLAGTALAGLALAAYAVAVVRRLRRASTRGRLMAGGLAAGLLAIALHSAFDYGLHKPANALLLAALAAMCAAAVHVPGPPDRQRATLRADGSAGAPATPALAPAGTPER